MNDQDYQFLVKLYETKNITKTAQQMFLSQPTLTKRIYRIEKELGCQLIYRSRRGVEFTSTGELVVKHCIAMLTMNELLKNEINQANSVVGGSLSIGSSSGFSRHRLPAILSRYRQLYPMVEVQVTTGHSPALYRSLNEEFTSLSIVRGNYAWDEGSVMISSEPVCLVRSYENATIPLSDLPYLAHHTDADEERRIERWLIENSVTPRQHIWVDDCAVCCEMAQSGLGWTIIPSLCLDSFDGEVQPLSLKDGTPLLRNTYALYRNASYQLQQVKLFIDILKEFSTPCP